MREGQDGADGGEVSGVGEIEDELVELLRR